MTIVVVGRLRVKMLSKYLKDSTFSSCFWPIIIFTGNGCLKILIIHVHYQVFIAVTVPLLLSYSNTIFRVLTAHYITLSNINVLLTSEVCFFRYVAIVLSTVSRLMDLTLNIPSLARQRCNFSTVWCGRLLKLCFLGFLKL